MKISGKFNNSYKFHPVEHIDIMKKQFKEHNSLKGKYMQFHIIILIKSLNLNSLEYTRMSIEFKQKIGIKIFPFLTNEGQKPFIKNKRNKTRERKYFI